MKTMIKRRVGGIALVSAIAMSLAACGGNQAADTGFSGTYAAVYYPGLNNVPGSTPARFSSTEINQLLQLDQACRTQLEGQLPGRLQAILQDGAENSIFTAIGVAAGAGLGFKGIEVLDYLAYGAGAGAGSGAFYGNNRHRTAVNYAQAYCTATFTWMASERDGALSGVAIVPWMGPGRTTLPAPTGAPTDPTSRGANPSPEGSRRPTPMMPSG
ncbi:hypothetical protein KJ819_02390 [Patescibacteria group bacterium]|nr:hypothetical protein [Patescibacteria group bacterium]MBU1500869.1 hypothetical protein [Patescibacteria group bacterium]MBU2080924.1 hypothetical protein [Patescibacteria group bacterium]MBU2124029.1 hypothetical protein [Patescibacteria group bacterium]MBU2194680.1 hypothetical protein [Patescibacteria group bacterium]